VSTASNESTDQDIFQGHTFRPHADDYGGWFFIRNKYPGNATGINYYWQIIQIFKRDFSAGEQPEFSLSRMKKKSVRQSKNTNQQLTVYYIFTIRMSFG
jgi:hypothetical protein